MAFTAYHNVTGSTGVDVELLSPGDKGGNLKSILITNIHDANNATVNLFFAKLSKDSTAQELYYILYRISIPSSTSLLLDDKDLLSFNNSNSGYGLYTTVGSTDTVDILLNK